MPPDDDVTVRDAARRRRYRPAMPPDDDVTVRDAARRQTYCLRCHRTCDAAVPAMPRPTTRCYYHHQNTYHLPPHLYHHLLLSIPTSIKPSGHLHLRGILTAPPAVNGVPFSRLQGEPQTTYAPGGATSDLCSRGSSVHPSHLDKVCQPEPRS